MSAADALIDWFVRQPSVDGVTIVGWQLELAEGEGLRAGIRESGLGGPYEGPGIGVRLAGNLEAHWSDGRLTRAGLDRRAVTDPASELHTWRAAALEDRLGRLPPLAGPADLPDVLTSDPAIGLAEMEDSTTFLAILRRLLERCQVGGVQRIDSVLRAGCIERTVATSRGFRATWLETTFGIELWADEIAAASYGRRCLPTTDHLNGMAADVAALAPKLRTVQALPPDARGVLFVPAVVDALLGRLLLPNLSGRAIRDARSPFTRQDVADRRSIVRDDLDLIVDTTLPFSLATAPCSPEGVPAGRVRLIEGGRLVSPTLDLETAIDLALPPTPSPRGRPHALLQTSGPLLDVDAALALLGSGIIVRQLPGLHTQQPRRSAYALVAPDAQAVSGGVAGGRCAVRLAGNFLDHLVQPTTRLVRMSGRSNGEPGVGLLVVTGVELLPA